jgi:hypothetical protein
MRAHLVTRVVFGEALVRFVVDVRAKDLEPLRRFSPYLYPFILMKRCLCGALDI